LRSSQHASVVNLDLSSEKEGKGKFWSSWFKPCKKWHCFNLWKASFRREILLISFELRNGRIMVPYVQKVVIFSWIIEA
jgi:hypothetical protein